jgi:hypothetical protein
MAPGKSRVLVVHFEVCWLQISCSVEPHASIFICHGGVLGQFEAASCSSRAGEPSAVAEVATETETTISPQENRRSRGALKKLRIALWETRSCIKPYQKARRGRDMPPKIPNHRSDVPNVEGRGWPRLFEGPSMTHNLFNDLNAKFRALLF